MVWVEGGLFLLGLILLIKGSDFFVESAGRIAKKLGVSDFVIGLTLVAVGTSLPELVASVIASYKGYSSFVIGNILGSNIANIGLIVGFIATFYATLKVRKKMFDKDGLILMFVSALFYFFLLNGVISFIEGILLLFVYLVYVLFLFTFVDTEEISYKFVDFINYFFRFKYLITIRDITLRKFRKKEIIDKNVVRTISDKRMVYLFKEGLLKDFIVFCLSLVAVLIGGKFLVDSSVFFAQMFNLPLNLISLSVVAIGTSLPELSVSIMAARKGFSDIIIGNILGSNIANILLVIGISALIHPINVSRTTILFFGPVMLLFAVMLLSFMHKDRTLSKKEGLILFLSYIIFIAVAFYLKAV